VNLIYLLWWIKQHEWAEVGWSDSAHRTPTRVTLRSKVKSSTASMISNGCYITHKVSSEWSFVPQGQRRTWAWFWVLTRRSLAYQLLRWNKVSTSHQVYVPPAGLWDSISILSTYGWGNCTWHGIP
jgi:hypothetical protein